MVNISTIMELASKLSLTHLAKRDIKLLDTANENELLFLEMVLREELWLRGEKKKDAMYVKSRLLDEKTFEGFDEQFQPSITKWHKEKLKGGEWINDRFNVVIAGGAGTGKTHLATAIGHSAIANMKKTFYATLKDLVFLNGSQGLIRASKSKLNYIRDCDVVIIDEFGYAPIKKEEALFVYNLLNEMNAYASIVIVTNRVFSEWKEIFNDEVLANTLVDRLVEKCQMFKLTGESYRLLKHRTLADKD